MQERRSRHEPDLKHSLVLRANHPLLVRREIFKENNATHSLKTNNLRRKKGAISRLKPKNDRKMAVVCQYAT